MGVMRWPPSEFWGATPYDFWMAFRGYCLSKGITKKKKTGLSQEDADRLRAWAREERRKDLVLQKQRQLEAHGKG